jgi:hypothetical protein
MKLVMWPISVGATLANADQFGALQKRAAAEAQLRGWHAQLRAEAVKILSEQNANNGMRKLAIQLPSMTDVRLTMLLEPYEKAEPPRAQRFPIKPLAQW